MTIGLGLLRYNGFLQMVIVEINNATKLTGCDQ